MSRRKAKSSKPVGVAKAQPARELSLERHFTAPAGRKREILFAGTFLLVAVVLVFGRSVTFEFVDWDDNINVYENPNLLSWQGLLRLWKTPYASLYVPVVYTTYFLECRIVELLASVLLNLGIVRSLSTSVAVRLTSALMHFDNLLLHVFASTCVYRIIRRLDFPIFAALAGALLFAIHPLQTEPVVWVTGRKDLLCWALGFFALERFFEYTKSGSRRPWVIALATIAYGLALLSKPTAVVVPLLAGTLLLLSLRGSIAYERRLWYVLAVWGVIGCGVYLLGKGPQSDLTDLPFRLETWKRPFLAAFNLGFYLEKLILPVRMIPIYPLKIGDVFRSNLVWLYLPALIVVTALAARSRIILLAWLWIIIPVLPTLGLVPFIYQYFSVVADRYFYGSMAGVAILVAFAIQWAESKLRGVPVGIRKGLVGLGVTLLFTYAAVSFVQAGYWQSSEDLWRRELSITPQCVHALYNLASRRADAGKLEEAAELYERILIVDPYYAAAYTNLILICDKLGRKDDVRTYSLAALELPPNCAENFLARGHAYLALGRPQEAVDSFRGAVHGLPEDAPAHNSLGMALAAAGQISEAEAAFRKAISLNPGLAPAHANLADLLLRQKRVDEAIEEYKTAIMLDPGDYHSLERLRSLGLQGDSLPPPAKRN